MDTASKKHLIDGGNLMNRLKLNLNKKIEEE